MQIGEMETIGTKTLEVQIIVEQMIIMIDMIWGTKIIINE